MLVADRAKYFGLIFCDCLRLVSPGQSDFHFIGIMTRPASQIQDVVDADIWVMDPQTLYSDEVYALRITTSIGFAVCREWSGPSLSTRYRPRKSPDGSSAP